VYIGSVITTVDIYCIKRRSRYHDFAADRSPTIYYIIIIIASYTHSCIVVPAGSAEHKIKIIIILLYSDRPHAREDHSKICASHRVLFYVYAETCARMLIVGQGGWAEEAMIILCVLIIRPSCEAKYFNQFRLK